MKYSVMITTILLLLSNQLQAAELQVHVQGFTQHSGSLFIQLIDSQQAYEDTGRKPMVGTILPVTSGSARWTLHDIAPGDYGIQLFQDTNANKELDKNLVGIPTEPWGFSNNATGSFGPPDWQDVRFTLTENGKELTIHLNH